jgi:hypothetical protein
MRQRDKFEIPVEMAKVRLELRPAVGAPAVGARVFMSPLSLPRFRGHVVYAASAPSRRSASTSFGVL